MKVNEVLLENKNNAFIKQHIHWLADQLDIKKLPKITLLNDPVDTTFGQYDPDTKSIKLVTGGRHPVDVLRTLAHELTHYKQDIENNLPDGAGETGTDQENEANANAGIVMRDFAQENPDQFGLDNGALAEGSLDEIDRREFLKGLGAAAVAGAAGASNATDLNTPINDLKIEHEYKMARAKALGKAGKPFNIPGVDLSDKISTPINHLKIKHEYDLARAEARGAAGLPYDGPDSGYPASREVINAWKMARARARGASGLPLNQESVEQGVAEASYPGNIGMMEVAKFFNMATPKEKIKFERLMNMGEKSKAWQLIQQVTGVKLQGKEFDLVAEHIVKHGSQFRLLSKKGKNLGTFPSHKAAAKHEGEVEYFKAHPKK